MTDDVLALSTARNTAPGGLARSSSRAAGRSRSGIGTEFEQELREIQETQPGRILIDLRSLDFMDCTGISLMIRAQQSAHANGHLLALRRGPDQVQRLFQLTGLLDHFTFLD